MIKRLIRQSLGKNKLVSVLMAGFLVVAAALLSGALMLTVGLFGTVDSFMENAKTPHFMQMHAGPLDTSRMQAFADDHPDVVAWEAIEFLNVENSQLLFNGESLESEIQQNGFSPQSRQMDFLLSLDGEVIHPDQGEIWVPLFYEARYNLEPGQHITLHTPQGDMVFTIAGTFRDAQMNSALANSKRLLISDEDYADLKQRLGVDPEYLISFRLESASDATSFESAYFAAGLENNGPSLTWSLFRLINSINDVITSLLFMAMAFIILLISLLCIRYSLLTTMEEDLHEIGVMKSLGVSNRQVQSIYAGKYRLLLGAGCLVGFAIAMLLREPILANARRQMGTVNHPLLGVLVALIGVLLLYLVTMGYVRRVLKRLRSIQPLQALQGTSGLVAPRRRPAGIVRGTVGRMVPWKMALANVRRARGQHVTILVMAALITLVLLIPFRFGATMRSPDFVTFMGIGEFDIRVDLSDPETAARIESILADDARVETVQVYMTEIETTHDANGDVAPLHVDYGDPAAFPFTYADGRAPQTESEMGLSRINAERLGVGTGDTMEIQHGTGSVTFTITGTYQDVSNGGKTAKAMVGPATDSEAPGVIMVIGLADGASVDEVSDRIYAEDPNARLIKASSFVQQLMGGMIDVMDNVAWLFSGVAVLISALIAGLSIRLMQVQERRANAIQGALGFTTKHLRSQYLVRIGAMVSIGVLIGVLLATPAGNLAANGIFSSTGISGASLKFSLPSTVLGSVLVLLSTVLVTLANTRTHFNRDLVDRLRA